ncbi:MAG: alpha/beta hydrolase [Candidatus Hodarchaeales archaeon]
MNRIQRDLTFLDRPEIVMRTFFPRRHQGSSRENENVYSLSFEVDDDIHIVGRFHRTDNYANAPTIMFFHGNGETAFDYDFIAPSYQQMGINIFISDYRGYGKSDGQPSFSSMIYDSHAIYRQFRKYLITNGFSGHVSVMGRSLGSASAIELASHYQEQLACLIIESGFAFPYDLFKRLGIPSLALPEDKEEIVSPLPLIKRVKIPTLIIHGENDIIIPLKNGVALHKNVASENKDILIIPRAGHNDLLVLGPEDYMAAIEKIIAETSRD